MEKKDQKIYCNCCGKTMKKTQEPHGEEYLQIQKEWGYFSKKDGEIHRFALCEDCYDAWIGQFSIPVEIKIKTELL